MNRFALLSLYRSLTRHKLYAALNIGGLAVGIAVFLILGLYVRFETSYETWLPRHEGIYLVQSEWKGMDSPFVGVYPNTMGGLLTEMKQDFPGLVGTRYNGGEKGGSVIRGGVAVQEDVAQVDADFFKVFDLPMVSGDGAKGLASTDTILISRSLARKYFGEADPVGQTLTVAWDKPRPYRVAGVFENLPANSDFRFNILLRFPTVEPDYFHHWGSTSLYTYLRFPNEAAARAFEQKMPAFVDRRALKDMGKSASANVGIRVLPIARQHLEPAGRESASAKLTVVTLGLVGVLTLLIAILNYVNLATARAGLRAREVAMRKVLGADRGTLVGQFLGEAILTVAAAALLGLILAELGLPLVNAAGGLSLAIPYALVVPGLVVLALVVGTLAGFYPAVMLSRFPAAAVLASARSPGGGRAGTRTREALVMLQFGLAIAFVVGTLVMFSQTRHLRTVDLGFQRQGLMIVPVMDDGIDAPQRAALLQAFRQLPGVQAVGQTNSGPGGVGNNNADNVPLPGVKGNGPSLRWIEVDKGFFSVVPPRILAGRVFDLAHRTDDSSGPAVPGQPRQIVINRQAVAKLGFRSAEDAIGKVVGGDRPRQIIGVIEELRFFTPRLPVDPTYYRFYPETIPDGPVAMIRFTGDPRAMRDRIAETWRRIAPQVAFQIQTADQMMTEKYYKADDQATRLFTIGAVLAVLIGCVGLWGLASFNTARRVKEIGIRKTLGASATDIVKLLVGQFLRPVLIANLIAWPLAFVAMRTWLAGFDDRIALSPLFFLAASALATGIAVLTVIGQSLRASRAAPAWALRHE
ncbi:ABC transporter permease [uncultured Sphingomonas sp.]|uniref:ABC transporter permease n=1 Tax=uncultured Sphingomonas sp. TaxID=158754 RepID=UPI003748F292